MSAIPDSSVSVSSSGISVSSSSAVENRKLGKPREGELEGEDVLRRSLISRITKKSVASDQQCQQT